MALMDYFLRSLSLSWVLCLFLRYLGLMNLFELIHCPDSFSAFRRFLARIAPFLTLFGAFWRSLELRDAIKHFLALLEKQLELELKASNFIEFFC